MSVFDSLQVSFCGLNCANVFLSQHVGVAVNDCYGEKALNVLNVFTSEINMVFSKQAHGKIEFICSSEMLSKKEEYCIDVGNDRVTVTDCDELGARNAAVSLYYLIERAEQAYFVKNCSIPDVPVAVQRQP